MRSRLVGRRSGVALGLLALSSTATSTEVAMCTDLGAVTIELFDQAAPLHVANFLEYVDQGYYSSTVFHRVIAGFMIQGGGYDRQLSQKPSREPVRNESQNGRSNLRGTLAAARTGDPHSATGQYYINLVDNSRLDASGQDLGYTVFGRVVENMEVVDQIAELPTRGSGPFPTDVPEPLVGVKSMARLDREVSASLPEVAPENALREHIAAAVDAGAPGDILDWIGHFRASCQSMDAQLLLIEARAAAALLRGPRAKSALDEYFALATDADEGYEEALELYGEVAPGAEPKIVRAVASCNLPQQPEVPDGTLAPLEEMVEGQTAVRDFMAESQLYLDCLSEIIDERGASDEQQANAVREHNRIVAVMEQLAEEFNAQVRAFRARQ